MSKFETIQQIVAEATECSINEITLDSSSEDVVGWDSLAQLAIMTAIATKYKDLESDPRLQNANSVRELMDLIHDEK